MNGVRPNLETATGRSWRRRLDMESMGFPMNRLRDCATRPDLGTSAPGQLELLLVVLVSHVKLTQLKDPCQLLSCKFSTLCMVSTNTYIIYIFTYTVYYIYIYIIYIEFTCASCPPLYTYGRLSGLVMPQQLFGTGFPKWNGQGTASWQPRP